MPRGRGWCVTCGAMASGEYCRDCHANVYGRTSNGQPKCKVADCDKELSHRGCCKAHGMRDLRYGSPTASPPEPAPVATRCAHRRSGSCGECVVQAWWPLPPVELPAVAASGWQLRSACGASGHPSPDRYLDQFFRGIDARGLPFKRPPLAMVAACAVCPVRGDCLRDAMDSGEVFHGWRGGLAPADRRALRRRERRAVA